MTGLSYGQFCIFQLLFSGFVTSIFGECPFLNPQAAVMTCMENIPLRQLDPMGLSKEGMQFMCSAESADIVSCIENVLDECKGHPSLRMTPFNRNQHDILNSLCPQIMEDIENKVKCVESALAKSEFIECTYDAVESRSHPEEAIDLNIRSCRRSAKTYNCFAAIVGPSCGNHLAKFIVAALRGMEPAYCTPIVDSVYQEPVSKAVKVCSIGFYIIQIAVLLLYMIS